MPDWDARTAMVETAIGGILRQYDGGNINAFVLSDDVSVRYVTLSVRLSE